MLRKDFKNTIGSEIEWKHFYWRFIVDTERIESF